MYSQILSNEVLGAVIGNAPDLALEPRMLAQKVLQVIQKHQKSDGPADLHKMPVKEVTEIVNVLLDENLSESRIGHVLGQMGLQKARRRDGYWVYWNARQIEILRTALENEYAKEILKWDDSKRIEMMTNKWGE